MLTFNQLGEGKCYPSVRLLCCERNRYLLVIVHETAGHIIRIIIIVIIIIIISVVDLDLVNTYILHAVKWRSYT